MTNTINKSPLKILLVQVRDDAIKDQELICFLGKLAVKPEAIRTLDVFTDALDANLLAELDAVIFAGAGAYNISLNDLPMQQALIAFAAEVVARGLPVVGICYGAHVLTTALGGEVTRDAARAEVGTYTLTTTDAAKKCPILSTFPASFLAQEGHKDHITQLPPGAVLLARSELSANQAWTLPGKPVYAVQFHPEMSAQEVIERVEFYRDAYVGNQASFDAICAATVAAPEACTFLQSFLDAVVQGGKTYPANTE